MRNPELASLRRKRIRLHKRLDKLEPLVARCQDELARVEAAIQTLDPHLDLPDRPYKPDPIFARGELRRLALDVMRGAGEPLSLQAISSATLAAKGIRLPDPHTMRRTRRRLH